MDEYFSLYYWWNVAVHFKACSSSGKDTIKCGTAKYKGKYT